MTAVMDKLSPATLACYISICGKMPILSRSHRLFFGCRLPMNNVIGPVLGTRMKLSEAPRPRSERCTDNLGTIHGWHSG